MIVLHHPELVAIEDVFYALNVKSALKLGHVRGVAMLAAAQAGLSVVAYSPLSVKSAVVGYGRAEKAQVQHMVARLLKLARFLSRRMLPTRWPSPSAICTLRPRYNANLRERAVE